MAPSRRVPGTVPHAAFHRSPRAPKEDNTVANQATWLTPQAFQRLTDELAHLQTEARAAIVRRIEAARSEGDLRENGGYHAAREEQAKNEARISQLKALLENAQVGEVPHDATIVAPGTVVTARIGERPSKFLIGSREAAGSTDLDVFSERSPLGAAICGASPGETRSYTAPSGREIAVAIEAVEPFSG